MLLYNYFYTWLLDISLETSADNPPPCWWTSHQRRLEEDLKKTLLPGATTTDNTITQIYTNVQAPASRFPGNGIAGPGLEHHVNNHKTTLREREAGAWQTAGVSQHHAGPSRGKYRNKIVQLLVLLLLISTNPKHTVCAAGNALRWCNGQPLLRKKERKIYHPFREVG